MPPVPSPVASPRVLRVALGSRACISLLALLTALLVKPYDTSTRLLLGSPTSSPSLLASLASWDAVFFTSIATRGYEYEHEFAFFPLYALLVRWTSALLRPVVDESLAVLLAGYLLSNACFVGAAVFLYRLGCLVLRHEPTARRAAYLFCITPSSIFMTAIYSER
jgi:GPI mannosyltransferase 2